MNLLLSVKNGPMCKQLSSHLCPVSQLFHSSETENSNIPIPTALTMNFRTYMRTHTMMKETVVNEMPTAAIVGALVSAFGLTVLYVHPIVQNKLPTTLYMRGTSRWNSPESSPDRCLWEVGRSAFGLNPLTHVDLWVTEPGSLVLHALWSQYHTAWLHGFSRWENIPDPSNAVPCPCLLLICKFASSQRHFPTKKHGPHLNLIVVPSAPFGITINTEVCSCWIMNWAFAWSLAVALTPLNRELGCGQHVRKGVERNHRHPPMFLPLPRHPN